MTLAVVFLDDDDGPYYSWGDLDTDFDGLDESRVVERVGSAADARELYGKLQACLDVMAS